MPQSSRAGTRQPVAGLGSQRAVSPFTEPIGPAGDAFEREADRMADAVVRGSLLHGGGVGWAIASGVDDTIQRKCAECKEEDQEEEKEKETIRRAPRDTGPAAAVPPLIVEDDGEVSLGQMRKGEFLAALRDGTCAAVDEALSGTGRDSRGCPWIDHWFGYYEGRSAAQVERSLHRYAPEVRGATAAADYIPAVIARIRRSARTFATTGEVSGVPDEMPGAVTAGGSVLGGMFFKVRRGGARDANPQSVRTHLGAGESLPGSVRTRMEFAFGSSFSHVRLHNDGTSARLSDRLNARAFTVGEHVAFGSGEFRPGTVAGDALIAHELAHVVQQGRSAPVPDAGRGRGEPDASMEHDADSAATGAVTSLWSPGQTRGPERGGRRLPRLRSGLRLQRCGSSQKKVDGKGGKDAKLTVREQRDSAISEAGERLRDVNKWASTQVKAQNVPSVSGVTNLEADQAKNVAAAIERLQQAQALFGTKELEALPAKLDEVRNFAREAYKYGGSTDQEHVLIGRRAIGQAVNAADEAAALASKLTRAFEIPKIASNVDDIVTTLNAVQAGKQSIVDAFDVIDKKVKASKNDVRELRDRFETTPKAITRIIFLLRSFLTLNKPELTTPPTADEFKQFTGNLGGVSADFDTVFGGGKSTMGFDVFLAYGRVLEQQLKIRERMAKADVNADSPIPSEENAEDLFKALKSKSNGEVFAAYMSYAQAYFYHRVVDKFQDMRVTDIGEFYKRKVSILGTRPLVCTGYALLGSHLLGLTGAKLITFIVAIRATDDNLLSGNIDAGHAVAKMNRGGKVFFVSNDSIVFTEDDAIGEDAVAWRNSKAPRFDGSAKTIPAATDAAWKKIEKKTDDLRNPKKQQRKK
jgi:hypothetical protein